MSEIFHNEELLSEEVAGLMRRFLSDDGVDPEKVEQADRVYEGVESFIESHGWNTILVDKKNRRFILGFALPNAPFEVAFRVDAETESLTINVVFPVNCREEYRMLMDCKLSRLNEGMRFGAFRLDEDDGEITYRFTYSYAEQGFLPKVFERYLECCLFASDMNYKRIEGLANGSLSGREKLEMISDIRKLADAVSA